VKVTFDPAKRLVTLRERGIDFATDAEKVFAGDTATFFARRSDYGEVREITAGLLNDHGLDTTGRSPSHHLDEVLPC
jgi:uncharacterized protein